MKISTIAVTGASGHLGRHIVHELLARGYYVRALYLNKKADISGNIEWIQGDVTHPSCVKELMKGTQVVIHAAGLVSVEKFSRSEILETNVLGTQNVVDYCTLLDRNVKLIHISSTSAVKQTTGKKNSMKIGPIFRTLIKFMPGLNPCLNSS